jgi:membrane-associated phospholipid phosphatase
VSARLRTGVSLHALIARKGRYFTAFHSAENAEKSHLKPANVGNLPDTFCIKAQNSIFVGFKPHPMKRNSLFKDNYWLFIPYLLMLAISVFFILFYSKAEIHIWMNQHHSPFADLLFKYASYMGEGWVLTPICLILLFVRFRYAFMAIGSSILAPLFTQFFKRVVWPDSPRPKVFFENLYDLHVVDGVHLHSAHSFPSGHATGAFAVFMVLALIVKNPFWKVFFFGIGQSDGLFEGIFIPAFFGGRQCGFPDRKPYSAALLLLDDALFQRLAG